MPFDLMIVLPPTDTNPKNLELAPPAVRIEPPTARSKSNALTNCAMEGAYNMLDHRIVYWQRGDA